MGMGLLNKKGPNAFAAQVDGHPEESDRVTVVQSRLCRLRWLLRTGCLRGTQIASAHLELISNGGPCELKEQCKRPDAYPVGEQDAALDNSAESGIGHTPHYVFQRRPKM